MKVLMVTERYLPIWGGAENQLHQLIPHLARQGCEVRIATRRWHGHYLSKERIDETEVVRLGIPGTGAVPTMVFILALIWHTIVNRKKIDILHSHGAVNMGALCEILAKFLRLKNVSKIATAGKIPVLQRNVFGRAILRLFKYSDAIISMTDEITAELRSISTPAAAIVKITNGVDAGRFAPGESIEKLQWKMEHGMSLGTKIVLFSSRLVYRKGLDTLLDGWPAIKKHCPDTYLIIVGSGSDQPDSVEGEMRKKVIDEGLERILFAGETKTPEQFFRIADVFVFPSRREGFPNVLMEALASGLPVVASRIGGVTAVLKNSDAGLTFVPEEPVDLSQKVIKVLKDARLAKEKGELARDFMLAEYSFQTISHQYVQLYSQITNNTIQSSNQTIK
jgi:glycosyltransferase involved in cell wall biosynthesis